MAAWASWSVPISTKPKPFERPVSRSMMTWADCDRAELREHLLQRRCRSRRS